MKFAETEWKKNTLVYSEPHQNMQQLLDLMVIHFKVVHP